MILRGPSGVGDHVYTHAIAREYIKRGENISIVSRYDEIFKDIDVKLLKWSNRLKEWNNFNYCSRKYIEGTNQWQDICIEAGLDENVEFKFEWKPTKKFIDNIAKYNHWKKIILVCHPRIPFDRPDGFGKELSIEPKIMKDIIDYIDVKYPKEYYKIGIGADNLQEKIAVNYDLSGRTTISEMMDLFTMCTMAITQVGFPIPICEGMGKPVIAIYSKKGLECENKFISSITPDKIHSKKTSIGIIDDWPIEKAIGHINDRIEL